MNLVQKLKQMEIKYNLNVNWNYRTKLQGQLLRNKGNRVVKNDTIPAITGMPPAQIYFYLGVQQVPFQEFVAQNGRDGWIVVFPFLNER